MVPDQTADQPNPPGPGRAVALASTLGGVFLYLLVAYFAVAVIVGSILDYDRRFPNPPFHMSPRRVAVNCCIAGLVMLFVMPRIVYHVGCVRRILRSGYRGPK